MGPDSLSVPSDHSPGRRLRASSPGARSPGSRLACAYSAFKCSSRAAEEDDHRALAPLPPRSGARYKEQARQSPSKSVGSYESDASSQLLELTGMDNIDHAPFEDPRDGDDDNEVVLTPRRTPSDDTHETPNVSNRDPAKFSSCKALNLQALPDPNYDEFCQSNFNTPRMLHTKGSLGDEISPFDDESDEQEEESDVYDTYFRSALQPDPTFHLQLPSMTEPPTPTSRNSLMSESSILFGESISEEKKVADEVDQGMTATLQRTPKEHITPLIETQTQETSPSQLPRAETESTPNEKYQKLQHEDSSYSTVSSFVEAAKDRPPFFWRSHPKVTVYSYDSHFPAREKSVYPMRAWHPPEVSYQDHRHTPHQGGSKMNLPSLKDRLLGFNMNNNSFGFDVTMTSFTSFATSRLGTFGLRSSSS